MGFFRFIFSKTFLLQLLLAAIALVVIGFLLIQWLNFSTNQDEKIDVPNLTGLTLMDAEDRLDDLELRMEVLDSASFNPEYPPFAVLEQVPKAGSDVKVNRKIYLTLNPSGYRNVEIPEGLVRRTRRQVEPTLRSIGFEVGEISYKADLAKDAVLELRHKGRKLEPGDELQETSVIDLVLGDGRGRYDSDSTRTEDEGFEDGMSTDFENEEGNGGINEL